MIADFCVSDTEHAFVSFYHSLYVLHRPDRRCLAVFNANYEIFNGKYTSQSMFVVAHEGAM